MIAETADALAAKDAEIARLREALEGTLIVIDYVRASQPVELQNGFDMWRKLIEAALSGDQRDT